MPEGLFALVVDEFDCDEIERVCQLIDNLLALFAPGIEVTRQYDGTGVIDQHPVNLIELLRR